MGQCPSFMGLSLKASNGMMGWWLSVIDYHTQTWTDLLRLKDDVWHLIGNPYNQQYCNNILTTSLVLKRCYKLHFQLLLIFMVMIDNDLLAEDGQVGGDLKFIGTVNTLVVWLAMLQTLFEDFQFVCPCSKCMQKTWWLAADTNIYCSLPTQYIDPFATVPPVLKQVSVSIRNKTFESFGSKIVGFFARLNRIWDTAL